MIVPSSPGPKSAPAFRRLAAAALLAGGLLAGGGELDAQRVVHILQEPRHRVVLQDDELYVLDVQIQPGDTTFAHTHDSPILYTQLSTGAGPVGGRVSSVTRYLDEPYTHAVSNNGDHLFRIIAIAHYGPGEPEESASRPDGLAGEPQLENRWFRSYRIELEPGEETRLHRHRHPVLIVQVGEGVTHVSREDGITAELARDGHWTWRQAESPYRIRNVGDAPAAVVINEARRAR